MGHLADECEERASTTECHAESGEDEEELALVEGIGLVARQCFGACTPKECGGDAGVTHAKFGHVQSMCFVV